VAYAALDGEWNAYGLTADLIQHMEGSTNALRNEIEKLLERIMPTAMRNGYSHHIEHLKKVADRGNSSDRQRKIYGETGSLKNGAITLRSLRPECLFILICSQRLWRNSKLLNKAFLAVSIIFTEDGSQLA
jgi:gamma-glutamyl:cysteine ligase YbdK (ATP-grasp superfamily)